MFTILNINMPFYHSPHIVLSTFFLVVLVFCSSLHSCLVLRRTVDDVMPAVPLLEVGLVADNSGWPVRDPSSLCGLHVLILDGPVKSSTAYSLDIF